MQSLRPHPDLLNQDLDANKIPDPRPLRRILCVLNLGELCFTYMFSFCLENQPHPHFCDVGIFICQLWKLRHGERGNIETPSVFILPNSAPPSPLLVWAAVGERNGVSKPLAGLEKVKNVSCF